jgi:DNA-binding transcriptional MerR regulator
METRVLTLFDDEDFYPKEEPKKKPKKEPVTKIIEQENTTQQPEVQEPELNSRTAGQEKDILQETKTEQKETFNNIEENVSPVETEVYAEANSSNVIIDEPKNKLPEEEERIEIIAADIEVEQLAEEWIDSHIEIQEDPSNETFAFDDQLPEDNNFNQDAVPDLEVKTKDDNETEAIADEEELNKQILSELVQTDYASLIHRDYPFDMNNASVVSKSVVPTKQEPAYKNEESEAEEEDNEVFEDIVPLPEWKLDKKYYTIGEVAQLFTVNTSHIRFWTNEFKLKPRTTRKGDRLYSPKDIAELRLIHHLVKEKKHTIKGAREKLKGQKNDVHSKLDLKDSLINLRDTLLKIKEQL